MTTFFAWNIRGFNLPRKQRALRSWIQAEKPSFGCLVETRVQKDNYQRCMVAAIPTWNSLTNYAYHPLGTIWVFWNDQVVVTHLHMSAQVITCAIQILSTGEQFICSAVYAFNIAANKMSLWEELRGAKAAYDHLNLPWILIGDCNETLASSEHSRDLYYRSDQTGMRHFQEAMKDCSVMDLLYRCTLFTWWNKRLEVPIGKKLDRALVNQSWLNRYPLSLTHFEAGEISDHVQCLIRLARALNEARKPFRFFNYLVEHKDFCLLSRKSGILWMHYINPGQQYQGSTRS